MVAAAPTLTPAAQRAANDPEGRSAAAQGGAAADHDRGDVSGVFALPASRWPRAEGSNDTLYALAYDVVAAPPPWGPLCVS